MIGNYSIAVGKSRGSCTVATTTITYSVAAATVDTTASAGNTHWFLKHEEI